jgi:hypothetical protein
MTPQLSKPTPNQSKDLENRNDDVTFATQQIRIPLDPNEVQRTALVLARLNEVVCDLLESEGIDLDSVHFSLTWEDSGLPAPPTIVGCVQCHREVELPPVPGKPGYVSVEAMDGWTAPPPRCPECSER